MEDMMDDYLDMEEDTQKDRYLTFKLDDECYGIEIRYVKEIVGIQTIIKMPDLPEYLKGIINLRGKIIPVMDVRLRFKKEPREYSDRTCVIVVDIGKTSIGLVVDGVAEVLTIKEQDTMDPPKINKEYRNRYISKIGKVGEEVKLLLDCDELLSESEMIELPQSLQQEEE